MRRLSILLVVILMGWASGYVRAAEKSGTQYFDSNGVKIAYFVEGQGEPVVLIHGWISSAWINWSLPRITSQLAKDYQVIALDVRGHGLSDKPKEEEKYGAELVEDVVRLLDHLSIKKAHFVGYSMGGIITGSLMAKHPECVLSGTLGGMGWLSSGGIGQWGFAQIGKNDSNAGALTVCGRSLSKLAISEEELKAIKVPVTVLVGDDDGLVKSLYVDPLQKIRKDWPVVVIKNANHLSCVLKPQFREEIAAALKRNAKASR